jgi:hypothetical protein
VAKEEDTGDRDVFTAEDPGPPSRRFWIARDRPARPGTVRGWSFTFDEVAADGSVRPGWDSWEEHYFEILRYPPQYVSGPLVWRRVATGEVVDLKALLADYPG